MEITEGVSGAGFAIALYDRTMMDEWIGRCRDATDQSSTFDLEILPVMVELRKNTFKRILKVVKVLLALYLSVAILKCLYDGIIKAKRSR